MTVDHLPWPQHSNSYISYVLPPIEYYSPHATNVHYNQFLNS